MAMTRDCKSLAFGLRRFESYLQHHLFELKAGISAFFLARSSIRCTSQEENTNLPAFNLKWKSWVSASGATRFYMSRHFGRFFSGKFLLSTLPTIGRKNCAFLRQKTAKNMHFAPVKTSVTTLNNLICLMPKYGYYYCDN